MVRILILIVLLPIITSCSDLGTLSGTLLDNNSEDTPNAPIDITNVMTSPVLSTGFLVSVDFTGDADNDMTSATLYYCNESDSPGCDPLSGTAVTMSKNGSKIEALVTGLSSPNDPNDTFNIIVVVIDPDGQPSTPPSGSITLDSGTLPADPSGWTLTSPANAAESNDATPEISATGIVDEDGSTAYVFSDIACLTSVGSAVIASGSFTVSNINLSTNDNYNFYGKIIDAATNESSCVDLSLGYLFDNVAPASLTWASYSPASPNADVQPEVKGTVVETNKSNSTIEFWNDNTCAASSFGSGTVTDFEGAPGVSLSGLAYGINSIYAQVTDGAGNASSCTLFSNYQVQSDFTVTSTADTGDNSTADGFCDANDTNNDGPCTLRAAIEQANFTGGTHTIYLPDGKYILGSEITITSNISIIGQSKDATIIDGGEATRVFRFNGAGKTFSIDKFTLQNGSESTSNSGGGVRVENGNFTASNCRFYNNKQVGAGYGGAIAIYADQTTIDKCLFDSNYGTRAGAIDNRASLTITNSEFRENTAQYGAAIRTLGDFSISNILFYKNKATYDGGGIYFEDNISIPSMSISAATFFENESQTGSSMFFVLNTAATTLNLDSSTFYGNKSYDNNGGTLRFDSNITINLRNTILAASSNIGNNPSVWHCHSGAGGTINSLGYNLTDLDSSDCDTTQPTDINSTDSQLSLSLSGAFPQSLIPSSNSPAIDNGDDSNCFSKDASGRLRLIDLPGLGTSTCDIGAAERQLGSPPLSIAYNRSWRVYIKDHLQRSLTPTLKGTATSYSITPALPVGLAFSTSTGVISGTPTVTSSNEIYKITASNTFGSISTTLKLEVLEGYIVNTLADEDISAPDSDSNCNSTAGNCSLRAAIEEANGDPAKQAIFVPDGSYVLDNALGSLNATTSMTIIGESLSGTIINGVNTVNRRFLTANTLAVDLKVSDLSIINFTCFSAGAGFSLGGTDLSLSHVRAENLSGYRGGVIRGQTSADIDIEYSQFEDNDSQGENGGAISAAGTSLSIRHSHFKNNDATGANGGHIEHYSANFGDLTIESSTFEGGKALDGAAIKSSPNAVADMLISNSTFYNNQATNNGGVIYLGSGSNMLVYNNTFVANDATNGGGVFFPFAGTISMSNNLFDNNTGGIYPECVVGGTYSLGGNISDQNSSGCHWIGTDQVSTEPLLADASPTLANGGYVPTMSLLGGSPAIDKGLGSMCTPADTRGEMRPIDELGSGAFCDAGALEKQ